MRYEIAYKGDRMRIQFNGNPIQRLLNVWQGRCITWPQKVAGNAVQKFPKEESKAMASKSSSVVQILIALITVLGSLGVAYITTGAKFSREVDAAKIKITEFSNEVKQIKDGAQASETRLQSQQAAGEKQIQELKSLLADADKKTNQLQSDLALLKKEIETSNTTIKTAAEDAVKSIRAERIQPVNRSVITARPTP